MQDRVSRKPVVVVLMGAYWPGNEASGPIQSFKGLAKSLSAEFDFRLVARDRPFGASKPLPAAVAKVDGWIDLGFAKARYLRVGRFGARGLGDLLAATPHDLVWLNGFFDREFTIPFLLQRRLGLSSKTAAAMLSPRGEFSPGALEQRFAVKKHFLLASRILKLLDGVCIHATDPLELGDLKRMLTWHGGYALAPNVPTIQTIPGARVAARGDRVRLVFLSRIDRKKNVKLAIEIVQQLAQPIVFDIYGPVSDEAYWAECREAIRSPHIRYCGELPHDEVAAKLAEYDVFFFPTKGENFGHAIFEALACGVPVLISDQTPWRDLHRDGAGWDLPLDSPDRFATAIEEFAGLPEAARMRMSEAARLRAEHWLEQSDAVGRTRDMLAELIANCGAEQANGR
ncbi:glycosyl transferase, group 1 [Rhodovulum sp. PH10]|uniref:glycosyltransferase family 4 protein n=1 Tax=Rhodovulum sp. PH10 TaxID=1187851 RepID=UPI00027C2D77|nr:glycosyltransferase family 4 protein [Rhodovulum sp. PH10]EJW11544.1 glycosyl transferase, group 1 [Rhodovulum sp. PH10]